MNPTNRRTFMMQVAVSGTALAACRAEAEVKKLTETEPQALALGYREDTKTVDAGKYPKHAATQTCKNCMIFKGTGADGGSCHLFGSRILSGNGWCSQWAAKG